MLEVFSAINNSLEKNKDGNISYYYNPANDEKAQIEKDFLIDNHSLSSALDMEEVARFESEGNGVNIIWKVPTSFKLGDISSLNVLSVGLFIRKNRLIIVSPERCNYLNEKMNLPVASLIDVIFAFQYNTIKHFIEHLKIIKLMARELQVKINESMGNEYLLQMFNLSEILVYYLDAINGNRALLNKFNTYLIDEKIEYKSHFLNDLIVENDQASKQAEIYSQVFAGLMDARGNIVNNNMNVLIKNLTIINIIFLPLNLIASMGGMSEFSMMTHKAPWPVSYGLFSLSMILIGWLTAVTINRLGARKKKVKKINNRSRAVKAQ